MFTAKTTYDSSEKTWSGPKKQTKFHPQCSVGKALYTLMKMNPKNICQISDSDGVSLTNEEMLTISIRIAQHLTMGEDSIIGIMAVSSTYQAPVLFASWLSGRIFHPINPYFDKDTVRHLFGITRPEMIFCDADNYETLVGACRELNLQPQIYTINGRIEGVGNVLDLMKTTGSEDIFRPRNCRADGDETAMILCSSGTTGLPKGVCLSHSYLLKVSAPIPSGSVIFTFSTVDWLSGLSFLLHSALSCATRVCTVEKYSPQKLRQVIEKYKINIVLLSGSYMSMFVKSGEAQRCNTSSIQMFAVGGGNVSHPMYTEMQSHLKSGRIGNVYVTTEFGGVAANHNLRKPKSVGQLLDGVKVRIIDDFGTNLGVGETGEILLWNDRKWNGYYKNRLETENTLDAQGWYHTGDIGYFDEDGDLHLIDRKKEILKYRGYQYSAQEIENCILALDDVAEVCVFGTKVDEYGDLATAAVIQKPGSKLTETDIVNYVAREMPERKRLHGGVFFVEYIPKTGGGKYLRTAARDLCLRIRSN